MRVSAFALVSTVAALRAATAQQADSLRDTARVARVVVTATRVPLARERVAASVTVLDGEALREQGLAHLEEALHLVPGMAVVRSGSYGALTALFTRGGQSNYTKVLVDGVPINDPGGTLDVGTLTLDDVERIEVVRGPTSVLYGSDAVTGVVQIFTRRGGTSRASVDARGGTYGSYDIDARVGGGAGGALFSVGAAHHASDGIYRFNSAYRNDVGNLAVDLAPWSGATLRATARYADVDAHFPTDFTGAPVDPNSFRTEKRTLLGADLVQRAGAGLARLAVSSNLGDVAVENPANDATDFASSLHSHIRRQAADLSVVMPVGRGVTATVGGTIERQHQASPDTGRLNSAAYVELLRSVRLTTVTAGARLDHGSSFGDFGTFRLALAQRLPGALRVRGSVGTAFREPSFLESFETEFSSANPSLRPERTTSWEVGVERAIADEGLIVGATYFSQRFVDLIDYRFAPTGSTYENIARARAGGAEVELRAAPVRALTVDASYTYLDTRVLERGFSTSPLATLVEGGPLLRRPRHSGSVGVAFRADAGGTLDLRASYVGIRDDRRFHGAPTFDTEAVTLDPYTKVDIGGALPFSRLSPALRPLTATIRIDNLFAARYESVAGYATPGRVILAGLRAVF